MSDFKNQYDVLKGLLNGKQVATLSSEIILPCVQTHTAQLLGKAKVQYVLHDGCDIRKPNSKKMEHLGKVRSLSKQIIDGYQTMNSVVVDADSQAVNLLCHELYSNKMPTYIGETVIKDTVAVSALSAIQQDLISKKEYINTKVLYQKNLKASSEFLKKERTNVEVCHISDREFDAEEYFDYIDTELHDTFVSRLKTNRLSHETQPTFTKKGKLSKRTKQEKLTNKKFKNTSNYTIFKIAFHGKTYRDVTAIIEWESLKLETKTYTVVRITLQKDKKPLFEQPMLLLTNRTITNEAEAKAVYMAYLLRSKIEVVFKFLKQHLGWESFQIRDFNSIKNLLALVFFLAGYFPELEEQLKAHPLALELCKLAQSKGKITLHFILYGLKKLAHFQEVFQWMDEHNISKDQIDEIMKSLSTSQKS